MSAKQQDQNSSQHSNSSSHNQSQGRGFAGMDDGRQHEIASQGGKASQASGHAHHFSSDEAREVGSKSHSNSDSNKGSNKR